MVILYTVLSRSLSATTSHSAQAARGNSPYPRDLPESLNRRGTPECSTDLPQTSKRWDLRRDKRMALNASLLSATCALVLPNA